MSHILIVEDEAAIADTLVYALETEGFATSWLTLGEAALAFQAASPADLVILDVGLPDISGFEACRRLRRFSEVPVIFLTARNAEIDRVVGLEIGADDYVTKPFEMPELLARIEARLRRATAPTPPEGYRFVPSDDSWLSMVKVHKMAAGSSSRALRYASLPMKSALFTLGRSSPASTGLYSDSSSAPMRR